MGRIFKARYWVKLPNGNTKQGNEIEFTFPEDIDRASLYVEEKRGGRVSNIISSLTGHSASSIEVKELFDLGNKSSSERNSDFKAERDRKSDIKREKAQQKKDDKELDEYLDNLSSKYGSKKKSSSGGGVFGSFFGSNQQEDTRTPEQIMADQEAVRKADKEFFDTIKRNWKIILPITIIAAAIIAGMLYWNNGAKQEAEKLSQQLEQIEGKVKLAIQSGDREKSLELANQLVHPSHKDMESKEFDAFNGYPKYDEYWSKKRDEYKSEIMKLTGSTTTQKEQIPAQETQLEQTIETTPQQAEMTDFSNLIGEWKGEFGDNQLALTIEAINADGSVTGFDIVKGNSRPLTGTVTKNGDDYDFELKEPGNDKWDGVFKFSIYGNTARGNWTANNGKSTKQFTLTK
jgi:type II secretory pathway pseudopilin PulG